jgi:chromosome segregation ATPase
VNRRLQYLNLFGVLALAALCVFQWRTDSRLNQEINRLEKVRIEKAQKLSEQERALEGVNRDFTLFKEQFTRAQADLNDERRKLRETEGENLRLSAECVQLREGITNWANAVAERDVRLAEANQRINDLAERLNESIRKYNGLASNYNNVVEDLNAVQSRGSRSKSGQESNPAQVPPGHQD